MSRTRRIRFSVLFLYLFFILTGVLMLYPFWYVLMFSLSDPLRASVNKLNLYPSHFSLSTYKYVLTQPFLYTGFKNTIIVTVFGTLISMLLTIGCAYPLSKESLRGRKFLFSLIFFTMLFNGGLIPTYIVIKQLHMIDSLWALMVPSAVSVYNMLIMIKFYKGIPSELIESAKMDGAGDWYVLLRIVVPLSGAVNATIGLIYAVSRWNEFLPGVLYINDQSKRVLQVVLNGMLREDSLANQPGLQDLASSPESIKMAAVVISIVPILAVYPYLQKYFVKGMLLGSVKG
ncbi:carbohydrate ABC transporter permease [Cohnella ginsengisoli]|uniref:Carbohydrate ABC transporter permease n=1 Tax=Cohnella ginsengisoli TaxID=425004 RepID=A0A9X4QLW5_9BACL|nr:carbohydrate ABC transporter permease [Cohnella ginsengisoli]MDG0791254.1 carbohydrate ABC transporter permease [Cohnella ginsengisoli]